MAQQCAEHQEVIRLLKEHGAILARTKKHKIWKMPDGRSYTLPSSPSCVYSWKNNLADVRKFLGIVDPERGKPGQRRPKKSKARRKGPLTILPLEQIRPRDDSDTVATLLAMRDRLPSQVMPAQHPIPPTAIMAALPAVWWKPWTWKVWRKNPPNPLPTAKPET